MGEELQYLNEGFLRQLVIMVELKSGGGFRFLRSSITDEEKVKANEVKSMKMKKKGFADIEAMEEEKKQVLCFSEAVK